MTSQMKFKATVEEMRGRLKEAWGDLTDDDIDKTEGRWDQLIATIRKKTGESLEAVQEKVDNLIDRLRKAGDTDSD